MRPKILPFKFKKPIANPKKITLSAKENFTKRNGEFDSFNRLYKYNRKEVIDFLIKKSKRRKNPPEVLFVNAGTGKFLTELMSGDFKNLKLNVDIFNNYKNTINKELLDSKIVRKDLSADSKLMFLGTEKHSGTINKLLLNYDLVFNKITSLLVVNGTLAAKTNSKKFVPNLSYELYQNALLLKKGGKAYVGCTIPYTFSGLFEKPLNGVENLIISKRMVTAFNNKHNLDLKYKFSIIPESFKMEYINPKLAHMFGINKGESFVVKIERFR